MEKNSQALQIVLKIILLGETTVMDANPVLTKALCLLASPHLLIKTLFKRRAIRGSVLVLPDNPTVPQRKDLPKK